MCVILRIMTSVPGRGVAIGRKDVADILPAVMVREINQLDSGFLHSSLENIKAELVLGSPLTPSDERILACKFFISHVVWIELISFEVNVDDIDLEPSINE